MAVKRNSWSAAAGLMKPWQWQRLITVTEQLADLVRANAPLDGGLQALAADAPKGKTRELYLDIREDIINGIPFHEALANRTAFFPQFCVELIRVGEESGRLAESLEELASELTEICRLKQQTQSYAVYIIGVLLYAMAMICGLGSFALPQFTTIYSSFANAAPPTTCQLPAPGGRVAHTADPVLDGNGHATSLV